MSSTKAPSRLRCTFAIDHGEIATTNLKKPEKKPERDRRKVNRRTPKPGEVGFLPGPLRGCAPWSMGTRMLKTAEHAPWSGVRTTPA